MIKKLLSIFKKDDKIKEIPGTQARKTDLIVLIVLDGLGIIPRELKKKKKNKLDEFLGVSADETYGDATYNAKTPFLDTVWSKGRSTLMKASGVDVGLPLNEPGNSEVGHLNLGAGQIVQQSLPKINDAIEKGTFKDIPALKEAISLAKKRKTNFHLIGIISAGGVHGHIDHLFELIKICKANKIDPYIHGFLDGQDTPNMDGYLYLSHLMRFMRQNKCGHLASLSGRRFSMDRDERWHKTIAAYNCMIGKGERFATDPFVLLQSTYKNGEKDEFFTPTTMVDQNNNPVGSIKDNDILFFFNFREDRARQITRVFADEKFSILPKISSPKNLHIVTMTSYERDLGTKNMFEPHKIETTLADVIASQGWGQIHISETEKTAHVTYFFNGGRKEKHNKEKFYNIPSPFDPDYSKKPEMSAQAVTDQVLKELEAHTADYYSFMLINYANPDMVGHTGDYNATIKAVEFTDKCVQKVCSLAIKKGGIVLIVGDHGNCEVMIDQYTHKPNTSHTNNPVPFIVVDDISQVEKNSSDRIYKIGLRPDINGATSILADVAPTILSLLGVKAPDCMNGTDLTEVI